MPKSQYIDPTTAFQSGYIHFEDIPVNQYAGTLDGEKKLYTKSDMMRIYRDMRMIREFETMLGDIKTEEVYRGIPYHNPGPMHLSIGQEASAVGEAYSLGINDYIFGSHRSHGEVLAKGLSAIQKLSDTELYDILKNFSDGTILKIMEGKEEIRGNVRELAIDCFLYGTLSEIFARSTGFHNGLGGSMHLFFVPFGIFPNNAVVGGSAPLALGAALYKRINRKDGIVIANFGDGACGRGSLLEALQMSAMDQIKQLWQMTDNGNGDGLPILFHISDNFYGMGGQTVGETMGFGMAARLGAGINPEQMHAERINGYNPFAVIDAFSRKKKLLLDGKGPALLDTVTYRTFGHSVSDPSTYRTDEEVRAWKNICPIKTYREKLIAGGVASQAEFDAIDETIIRRMMKICRMAIDDTVSPRMDLEKNPNAIADKMFSDEKCAVMEKGRTPDVLLPKEENPRVREISLKSRSAFGKDGSLLPEESVLNLRDALFEAIFDKFYEDPTIVAYGEDNRDWGGSSGVYRGFTEAFPYHRFFNAPISESAIVGSAVGYAMCGGRVVAELMFADFIGCAGDEIINQMAKWQAMSAGHLKLPMILRTTIGSRYGAQHSQDFTALTAHIPGLKIVYPVTPYDAKGLMNTALNGTDPIIFFESQRIYDVGEQFYSEGVPTEYYEIELGDPDIKRVGRDITILSVGAVLYRVMETAGILEEQYGVSAEVIDARSIVPFDYTKVIASVKKTGRILVVGDACERNSVMKDMAANVAELAFSYLKAPPVALGSRNWITPCHELESVFLPQVEDMMDRIHEKLLPLPHYTVRHEVSDLQKIERFRNGV